MNDIKYLNYNGLSHIRTKYISKIQNDLSKVSSDLDIANQSIEDIEQKLNDTAIGESSMAIAQIMARSNRNIFNENSELVKTWVRLVQSGQYKEVPEIGNLKEIVYDSLNTNQE